MKTNDTACEDYEKPKSLCLSLKDFADEINHKLKNYDGPIVSKDFWPKELVCRQHLGKPPSLWEKIMKWIGLR